MLGGVKLKLKLSPAFAELGKKYYVTPGPIIAYLSLPPLFPAFKFTPDKPNIISGAEGDLPNHLNEKHFPVFSKLSKDN